MNLAYSVTSNKASTLEKNDAMEKIIRDIELGDMQKIREEI